MEKFITDNPWIVILVPVLAIWETIWKLIAFWKTARSGQIVWFVCIGIFNTIGILPIIYLIWFRKKPAVEVQST